MEFIKIRLLNSGLIYILQAKPGIRWESWLEPQDAVNLIKHLVKG